LWKEESYWYFAIHLNTPSHFQLNSESYNTLPKYFLNGIQNQNQKSFFQLLQMKARLLDEGEDKIEKSAKKEGLSAKEITKKYTEMFFADLDLMNINRKNITFPKASDHIKGQIKMVEGLEKKGFTYKTTDGIYYDTSKFKDYGKLGKIDIEGLEEGARVKINDQKKNPTDFALWKFSKPRDKRQQEWDSPWGVGFPGWHLECSAMSKEYLGETFDIHTGGIDLVPTHHNNEIAQSEGLYERPQSKFWVHHNHITINNEKISKSLHNEILLKDLEKKGVSPLGYRYWLLTADYKTLVNFTWEAVRGAETAYGNLIKKLSLTNEGKISEKHKEKFTKLINDDLNTPKSIALIWDLFKDGTIADQDKKATILDFDSVLGLDLKKQSENSQRKSIKKVPKDIKEMMEDRESARKKENWKKADSIREMIEGEGYELVDSDSGPKLFEK